MSMGHQKLKTRDHVFGKTGGKSTISSLIFTFPNLINPTTHSHDPLYPPTTLIPTRHIQPPHPLSIPIPPLPLIPTPPLLLNHNPPITTRPTPPPPPIRTQTTPVPPTRSLHPGRSRRIRIRKRNRRSHPRQLRHSTKFLIRYLLRRSVGSVGGGSKHTRRHFAPYRAPAAGALGGR